MIIIANWKSNIPEKLEEYLVKLDKYKDNFILSPPFTHLITLQKQHFQLSAQDFSFKTGTSSITLALLKKMDIQYCIIGHSEVGESRDKVYTKVAMLIENNITPILCSNNDTLEQDIIISAQNNKIILAYEPIENIGSGIVINKNKLIDVIQHIKFNIDNKVLYGGSVDENNFIDLAKIVDGFMIGKASLSQDKMDKILSFADNRKSFKII
jgi:triosephosphate isomerase